MWRSYLLQGEFVHQIVKASEWKVAQEHCTYTIWHPITSVAQHICINSSAESSVRAPIRSHLDFHGKRVQIPNICATNVLDSNESIRKPKTQLVSTCSDWHIWTWRLSSTQTFQTRMCYEKHPTYNIDISFDTSLPHPHFFHETGTASGRKHGNLHV